jgi:hypothetical protein
MPEEKEIVPEEKIEEQEEKKVEPSKEDFEKEKEVVPANKFNQTLRKQRELEAEKRELEKKLAEKEVPEEKEEEKKEEDIFEEEKKPDPAVLIDEKLKPVLEQISKREADNKKKDRTAFFSVHPKYLNDAESWQGLLDTMDEVIKPDSKFTYYEQLEMAHRIIAGDPGNAEVEDKKREMAGDAGSGGDGAQKGSLKDEFTAEDRKYQKEFNVSDEGMKAYKEKIKSGSMRILN